MKMIASADNNWAIGHGGSLLARVSADMKFFKSKTIGNTVILGRKTLLTFPNGRPLKERDNIIITHDMNFEAEGAEIVHSTEELLQLIKNYDSERLFVIGGGTVYSQLLPYCDTAYITRFDKTFDADTYIENLDKSEEWALDEEEGPFEENGLSYRFCTYKRVK